MDHDLSIDLVLSSLPESYSQFVLNFNMNKIEVTLSGLLNMLTQAENTIAKEKLSVHLVSSKKNKNEKRKFSKKDKDEKASTSKGIKPTRGVKMDKDNDKCHFCGKLGHWRRNCKDYLESIKGKKQKEASTSRTNDKEQ
ncbi:PREDICTED: uncharacterized protein LOC108660729 [Theobroma cacao]|uniref:Uncharacterized protein LOC108660729 n=1 Tax=Theobroma cacao TaxID=3641 RepID=A0AB32VX51_THECC|nr:PREDICTED: uncharacterized protein LOC108660729 [Theobroma cacao]